MQLIIKLTVAVCLTDEEITTGLIDIVFGIEDAQVPKKWLIMKIDEIIDLTICVNASFRTAELLWLCKSIINVDVFHGT